MPYMPYQSEVATELSRVGEKNGRRYLRGLPILVARRPLLLQLRLIVE